jgi:predicted transcriptional regulator
MIYKIRTRTRTEIMSQILRIANGVGARKTNIMHKAFLGYAQMEEYLRVLTENNLLNYDAHNQTFKTTEKGLGFLEAYNQMDGMIKSE